MTQVFGASRLKEIKRLLVVDLNLDMPEFHDSSVIGAIRVRLKRIKDTSQHLHLHAILLMIACAILPYLAENERSCRSSVGCALHNDR